MSRLRKHSVYSRSTEQESLEEDLACRLLFLGAGSVGKTSIIQRFLSEVSKPSGGHRGTERKKRTERTVHEMYSGNINFVSGSVSLSIEDTGANYSQNFPDMFEISLREADGVVLVYSVKDSASAEYISELRETIVSKRPDLPILVVGNQAEDERVLLSRQMEAIACLDWEVGYTDCSVRLDLNIQKVFREAVIQVGIVPRIVSILDPTATKSSLLKRFIFRQKNKTKTKEFSNISIY